MLHLIIGLVLATGVLCLPWAGAVRRRIPLHPGPRAMEAAPVAFLMLAVVWIYWPLVAGTPPTTGDNNYQLLKLVESRRLLERWSLFGWIDLESAGFPHNVLYPPGASILGALLSELPGVGIPRAYAWSMLLHEWAVVLAPWLAARLALGRRVALVTGAMVLLDPGGWWVGGWQSSFDVGMWIQAFSTALLIAGLAVMPSALEGGGRRMMVASGLLLGGAVVVHPQALTLDVVAVPLMILAMASTRRVIWGDLVRRLALIAAIALVACAWWLVPFAGRRAFSSPPFYPPSGSAAMWGGLVKGELLRMPPLWMGVTLIGVLMLARRRDPFSRFIVLLVPSLPILLNADALNLLHLRNPGSPGLVDQLQLERVYFLVRPLGAIAASYALTRAAAPTFARASGDSGKAPGWLVRGFVALNILVLMNIPGISIPGWPEDPVPRSMTPTMESEVNALLAVARRSVGTDGRLVLVHQSPSVHDLVGPAALTGLKLEKVGSDAAMIFENRFSTENLFALARIGGAAVLSLGGMSASMLRLPTLATAGPLQLRSIPRLPRAWLEQGPGRVEVLQWDDELIRLRATGTRTGDRIELGLAYYDTWRTDEGEVVQPFELALAGPQPEMGSGTCRPTLAAIAARDGEIVLRYHAPWVQWLGAAISILGLVCLVGGFRWADRRVGSAHLKQP